MDGSTILLGILALCALGIMGVLYSLKRREEVEKQTVKERIRPYVDQAYREKLAQQKSAEQEASEGYNVLEGIADQFSALALSEDIQEPIRDWLLRAGMRVRPAEFIIICFVVMVVNAFFFALLGWGLFGGASVLLGILGFSVSWLFPVMYVVFRRRRRMSRFNDQLLDLITLISNSLKSGYGFAQSLQLVADEADPPAQDEFNRVIRENNLGLPLNQALQRLVERMDSEDLDLMVTAVLIQRQIGGNLSQVLDSIAETIRERIRLQGQIDALTAQGKLGGLIISLLPFGLAGVFSLLKGPMMYAFVTDIKGIALIVMGLILQGIGFFAIWNIVNIDI